MLIDPVCGKRIKRQRAHIAIDYGGTTYYLCCPRCQADFEREPYKFARSEYGEKARTNLTRGKTDRRDAEFGRRANVVRGIHSKEVRSASRG